MKLAIVIPSAQYVEQAGARIRYQRMAVALEARGVAMTLIPIDSLPKLAAGFADLLLLSKCQDARGVAAAHAARAAGIDVGVDLFDDYFSQSTDSRFAKQRAWLRAVADAATFALCSTRGMEAIAHRYMPGKPVHILNDPAILPDADALATALAAKAEQVVSTRRLPILWFGMGDNPNFPVGLHDLAVFGRELAAFSEAGYTVDLTILTNMRALVPETLAALRQLPMGFTIDVWSEERERQALAASFISFLPVNAQNFSIAKSPNRALSALTGGTQVLSAGYPLYAGLDPFLYRDARLILADLEDGKLRNGAASVAALMEKVTSVASPDGEADMLCRFFADVRSRPASPADSAAGASAILHGHQSSGAVHKFAQGQALLSFGSPFTPGGTAFDAHWGFFGEAKTPALRLSKTMVARLPASLARLAVPAPASLGKGPPMVLPEAASSTGLSLTAIQPLLTRSAFDRVMLYPRVMEQTKSLYRDLFGPLTFTDSELDAVLQAASLPEASPQGTNPRVT